MDSQKPDMLNYSLKSTFSVLEKDFSDSIYFIFVNETIALPLFQNGENIEFEEQQNTVTTNNTINTMTNTEESKIVVPAGQNEVSFGSGIEEKQIRTTTTTSTNTNVDVSSKILNKFYSEREFIIPVEVFKNLKYNNILTLRIYDTNGDFWNIRIPSNTVEKWLNLSKGLYDVHIR